VSKQILLVEDAPEVVALLLLTLNPARFVVTVTDSLATARVAVAASPAPDLVLLDVDLPDGEGFALCRELKAASPLLPVLALKLAELSRARRQAMAAGADLFLPQPADLEELTAGVDALLTRAAGGSPPPAQRPHGGNGA
jgi:DNA-binding response OmpR family regulator